MSLKNGIGGVGPVRYRLEAPEGGWGYVLALGMSIMFVVTVGPLAAFGIIYGKFLAQLGDEASATTLMNCILNTLICAMGLVANHLLQTHSCRFVGIVGSIFFFTGNFLTAFGTSLLYVVITFGVLQGIGFGLMLSATFASFNEYFIVRKNFIMGVSQTIIGAAIMVIPYVVRKLMDEYGYRGTVAILSAISLHSFAAMLTLQPVEWHKRRVPITNVEMAELPFEMPKNPDNEFNSKAVDDDTTEKSLFLGAKLEITDEKGNQNNEKMEKLYLQTENDSKVYEKSSETTKNKNAVWNSIYNFFELSLMRDPVFVNISLGVSASFMSDILFLSILPMVLSHRGFSAGDVALLMTLYVAADLIGRLLLSLFTAFVTVRNRHLFLVGTLLTMIVRFAFTVVDGGGWWWVAGTCGALGVLRCLLQVTIPLVLAEYSQLRFSAAFGLYMAICSLVSLAMGPLLSAASSLSSDDSGVLHLLTVLLLVCAVPWTCELMYKRFSKST